MGPHHGQLLPHHHGHPGPVWGRPVPIALHHRGEEFNLFINQFFLISCVCVINNFHCATGFSVPAVDVCLGWLERLCELSLPGYGRPFKGMALDHLGWIIRDACSLWGSLINSVFNWNDVTNFSKDESLLKGEKQGL